jgi:hypothetical protein
MSAKSQDKKFDPIATKYAIQYQLLERAKKHLGEFCNYFLHQIRKYVEKYLEKAEEEYNDDKEETNRVHFELLEENYIDNDEPNSKYIAWVFKRGKDKVLSFSFGFYDEFKLESDPFDASTEGLNFYVEISLEPKYFGGKNKLKKFWRKKKDELQENGYSIYKKWEDEEATFICYLTKVNNRFSLTPLKKEVRNAFQKEFSNQSIDEYLVDWKNECEKID